MTFYTVATFPSLSGVIFPVVRVPEWDTDVQIALSGRRTAFSRRAYPRYRYELGYSFLRTATANLELQQLIAFYNLMNGRSGVFVYNDSDDGTLSTQVGFGSGDGSTTTFQLTRPMIGSSFTFVEPVFAVATANIFNNGVLQTLNVNYTIGNTGIVTFVVAPIAGHNLTWTGTYGWYCRFDEDVNTFEKFTYNLYELKKLKFSTEVF